MNYCLQPVVTWVAVGLSCFSLTLSAAGQEPVQSQLKIVIIEGQGAINNIRQHAGRDAVVRVENAAQQPISGAAVVFTLPSDGPSGSFVNGEQTLVVTTDAQGQAAAHGLKPNNTAGKFEIRITASHQGQTATATITQFNMAVQNAKKSGNGKWVIIVLALGGAGAAGAVLGTRGSSSSSNPTQPPAPAAISITPGSGTVGPPQ